MKVLTTVEYHLDDQLLEQYALREQKPVGAVITTAIAEAEERLTRSINQCDAVSDIRTRNYYETSQRSRKLVGA